MQHEIKEPGPLLDMDGSLREPGYSLTPLLEYNRAQVKASRLRLKEWDYYLIQNDHAAVALTLADNAYMGMVSASVIDFEAPHARTRSVITAFPLGRQCLPESSEQGECRFTSDRARVHFSTDGTRRQLTLFMKRFQGDIPLQIELELVDEPAHSMSIATPFPDKAHHFYYNRKIIGMRAQGMLIIGSTGEPGGTELIFEPEDSFGLLDWGRGVWPYESNWYWCAAMGEQAGLTFGMNLGYGFGDTHAATENMLFVSGFAHKLGAVKFDIPTDTHGNHEFMKPWHITESEGRLELVFTPVLDRADCINACIIKSDQHQVFGVFNGRATLDDGSELNIRELRGFAEKVCNRW